MPILKSPGLWKMHGDLSLSQVDGLLAEAGDFSELAQGSVPDSLVLDLSGVEVVDTASLSLLLEFRRRAAQHKCSVSYVNLPQNLQSLAVLHGMESLLTV